MSKVGETLKAETTPANAEIATYSWMADKEEVGTEESLEVTDEMVGKKISVKVTQADGVAAISEETAAVEYPVPVLNEAENTSADVLQLTFDSDASKVTKDDLMIKNVSGTVQVPITSVSVDTVDDAVLSVKLSSVLKNGEEYEVTFKDEDAVSFTAKVGAVKKIEIVTKEAPVNTETPIIFKLLDADGIDVTAASKIDTTCDVQVEDGSYAAFKNDRASKASITFANVDDKATVSITYNDNNGGDDVTITKEIVCVEAEAIVGKILFKNSDKTNSDSNCYTFYDGGVDEKVEVPVETTEPDVYFYMADEKGYAIDYDSYEVESASDDIASVDLTTTSGRYGRISVTGNSVGSTTINVKAIKNDQPTEYTIPVEITDVPVIKTLKLTATLPTMSNSYDADYAGAIKVTLLDQFGKPAKADTIKAEEVNNDNWEQDEELKNNNGGALFVGDKFRVADAGLDVTKAIDDKVVATYTAHAAKSGSYTIRVTAAKDDKTIGKNISVTVKELPAASWAGYQVKQANGTYALTTGVPTTYTVDTTDKDLSLKKADTTVIRVAAYTGSLFAGYVRDDANGKYTIADGKYVPNAASTLINTVNAPMTVAVRYGNEYVDWNAPVPMLTGMYGNGLKIKSAANASWTDTNGNLKTGEQTVITVSGNGKRGIQVYDYKGTGTDGTADITLGCVDMNGQTADTLVEYWLNKPEYDKEVARAGQYTVELRFFTEGSTKEEFKSNTFKVTNDLYKPTVKITSKVVDGFATSDIEKVIETSIDMNNNEGLNESFVGAYQSSSKQGTLNAVTSDKKTCTWVAVENNTSEGNWLVFVPATATFRTE